MSTPVRLDASSRNVAHLPYLKPRLKPRLRPLCAALVLAFSVQYGYANPLDPTVINGQASFATQGSTLTVTNTPGAIINWRSFSIDRSEVTHFAQQSAASSVMNRVTGGQVSNILGTLSSNGQVFLINPGGIIFGAGATIDVAGLVASTLNLSNANFLAGKMQFDAVPGAGNVSNAGNITTQTGGKVYLIAPNVENSGVITAPGGEILLAAGRTVELVNSDNPGLRVEITAAAGDATNVGQLIAQSGSLGLFGAVVRNSGRVSADSAVMQGGNIVFKATRRVEAGGHISANGTRGGTVSISAQASLDPSISPSINPDPTVVIHTGSIEANGTLGAGGSVSLAGDNILSAAAISANGYTTGGNIRLEANEYALSTVGAQYSADGTQGAGGNILVSAGVSNFSSGSYRVRGDRGGTIRLLGHALTLLGASADASGRYGGGTILAGGDFQGSNPGVANSATTRINFSTTLTADALIAGDGGKVIVWADDTTRFHGAISARGGVQAGDGGFIEVSGKQTFVFGGFADAGAANGNPGTLLLDPKNIFIDASASISGGVFELVDPTPGTGDGFGQQTVVLSNNNVIVTDQNDDFVAANAGAAYLFNGATGALISTLTGSAAGDFVGSSGVTALSNGNYVVGSAVWANVGAATFGNGVTGFIGGGGAVSAANSLVGSTANDFVGNGGDVYALTNGNYVVASSNWDNAGVDAAGAVTFGNGASGVVGIITAANSLVGSTASDFIGNSGITALSNGNYVVASLNWDNAGVVNAGAVTFGGPTGVFGPVSAANSLVGTTAGDQVGRNGVTALTGASAGNYVVASSRWSNAGVVNAGAVTFGGPTGVFGPVSAANSLVGTTANDQVGSSGVTALSNGNYVVSSPNWDNAGVLNVGAATFGNGASGIVGPVTAVNSLVGTTAFDQVGFGVTALSNGNYVVSSRFWRNGAATNAGAVTFGNGTTGVSGVVSAANSLVGTTANDQVGFGVTALNNDNYVVSSSGWDNGTVIDAGAATWGNGLGGTVGTVSASNSLVGTTAGDTVSSDGVTALSNGNYVVNSSNWGNGGGTNVFGAVTWVNGANGFATGEASAGAAVSTSNSLHGSTATDLVGSGGVTALSNGNYVVSSPFWDNGAVINAGAATWGNGLGGTVGAVDASNSLVGSTANDQVGNVTALTGAAGNYVVSSSLWDNVGALNAGAVTFGNGTTGVFGVVSAANSLVGSTASNFVGNFGVTALSNGNYVVSSSSWDNAAVLNVGAATFGNGTTGITGVVSAVNSLVGSTAGDQVGSGGVIELTGASAGNYVVRSPFADNGTFVDAGRVHVVAPGGGGGPFTTPLIFTDNAAGNSTLTPAQITAITNTGTAVVLQASNDITLATGSDITTNNPSGAGGALTFQAGRSIFLNSNITTDDGAFTLVANERLANGVVDAQRAPGPAVITMAPGTTINAGSGNISITLNDGAGLTNNSSGDITLANLTTTGHVLVRNIGPTIGSGIVRADVNSLVTAVSAAFDVNGVGLSGEIGSALAPIRVTLANLAARTQTGGAFFDSPTQGLTIGGAALGGLTAVSTASGTISITAQATIAVSENIQAGTSGGVTLVANGALSDISITGSGGVNASGNATITLIAGQDIVHSGAASQINTDSGALNLTAGRDIVHSGGASQINSFSGTLNLTAGRDILHIGAGTGQINTFIGALTLMAGRDIVHTDANQINSSSGPMLLSAVRDIVHSGAASQINTNSGSLTILAGQDFIHSASSFVNTSGGAMTISTGRDFVHSASGSVNANTGTQSITVGRDFLYSGSGQVNTTSGAQTVTVANNLTLSGASSVILSSSGAQTVAVGNDLSLSGAFSNIQSGSGGQTITVGNDLSLANGADITSFAAQNIAVGGNVTLDGGIATGAISRIFGDPDVNLTVGGVIQLIGSATTRARIESNSPTSIYITFPNLASGGFFVNGVENTVFDAATNSGFVAGGLPAILNTNLIITYAPSAIFVPPAATNTGFLGDLTNTVLISGGGASGSSQSTISEQETEKVKEQVELIADGGTAVSGAPAQSLPVCK